MNKKNLITSILGYDDDHCSRDCPQNKASECAKLRENGLMSL